MGKLAAMVHPLDGLTAEEVAHAAAACKELAGEQGWGGQLRFNVISLKEPAKADMLAYKAGGPVPARQAIAILQTPPLADAYEVTLELTAGQASVTTWEKLPEGVQPLATPDDCLLAEEIAKADPEVVALLADRGFTDLSLVVCDPWSVHAAPCEGRLIQLFTYGRSSPNDNQYAKPLDLLPLVDLNRREVLRIDKFSQTPVIPSLDNNYHADLFPGPWRADLKTLNVVQPDGPSFTVEGSLVCWQKWQFRVGFNYREGLVLHELAYQDGDQLRPVMYRGSLVEMAVPYGDPREPFHRKCAFDVGDYGLGYCTFPLTLGCDCLGHIHYFDAVLSNSKGEPVLLPHAVCMHEEDVGLLWKHVEFRNGHSESRRSRRLVISFIATVVNYEYAFYWYLYQDGTIGFEIKLTGELSTNLLSEGEGPLPTHGTLVSPGVNAQHHQHLFCARLDMAVDDAAGGKGLLVSEVDAVAMPRGANNPHLNGFVAQETDLTTTSAAQRSAAPDKGRIWKIKNPGVMNPVSRAPVAYKLMAMGAPVLLADAESVVGRRAAFARHHLWVTPYSDQQKWPAGDFVLQSEECRGLAEWTKEDKSLVDADPVIWHSFGVTHIVRVEDFPVMPVEVTGFTLKPFGFFTGNPGLDIPPGKNAASKLAAAATTNGAVNGATCCGGNSCG